MGGEVYLAEYGRPKTIHFDYCAARTTASYSHLKDRILRSSARTAEQGSAERWWLRLL